MQFILVAIFAFGQTIVDRHLSVVVSKLKVLESHKVSASLLSRSHCGMPVVVVHAFIIHNCETAMVFIKKDGCQILPRAIR